MARPTYTQDFKPEQPADIILGDGSLAKGGVSIEPVTTDQLNKDHLEALAFMEEELEIIVAESSDNNSENPVMVGCNGVFKQFFRGEPTRAKRKFVDCLIVKTGRVSTPEVQVPGINGGAERSFSIQQRTAHKYPFTVLSDPNPKGREWLMRRMSEAV